MRVRRSPCDYRNPDSTSRQFEQQERAFEALAIAIALAIGLVFVLSAVGLIGLFGIAVQSGLVLVAQTRALMTEGLRP
jgi:Cu/Ag efflux pump CusA